METSKTKRNISFVLVGAALLVIVVLIVIKFCQPTDSRPESHKSTDSVMEDRENHQAAIKVRKLKYGSISGSILEYPDELPVGEAVIYASNNSQSRNYRILSQNDGTFMVENVSSGQWIIKVEKEGYGSQFTKVKLQSTEKITNVDFYLIEGATVFGRAEYMDGLPVKGNKIKIHRSNTSMINIESEVEQDGSFEIRNISPGRNFELNLVLTSKIEITQHILELDRGERAGPFTFVLENESSVSGSVFREKTGYPISGIQVSLIPKNNMFSGIAVTSTDKNGYYIFKSIPPCLAEMFIQDPRYFYSHQKLEIASGKNMENVDFYIGEPAGLNGSLKRLNGEPWPGVEVEVFQQCLSRKPPDSFENIYAVTGTDGYFELSGIVAERIRTIRFSDDNQIVFTKPDIVDHIFEPDEIYTQSFIGVMQSLSISGIVTDDDDNPVENARIYIQLGSNQRIIKEEDLIAETVSNSSGYYGLSDVFLSEDVPARLFAVKPEYTCFIKLINSEMLDSSPFTLDILLSRGHVISGSVQDSNGNPLPYIKVSAYMDRVFGSNCRTDMKGSFKFTDLKKGNYRISAFSLGNHHENTFVSDVPTGTEDLILVFRNNGVLNISVKEENSKQPVQEFHARYRVKDPNSNIYLDSRSVNVVSRDGKISFPSVAFGDLSVEIIGNTFSDKIENVRFEKKNSPLDLIFTIPPGLTLEGNVYGYDETEPLEGIQVRAIDSDPRNHPMGSGTQTDENGYFILRGLKEDSYILRASKIQGFSGIQAFKDVEVTGNQPPVTIFLYGHDSFYARILDRETQQPVYRASVRVINKSVTPLHSLSDANGNFMINQVPDGSTGMMIYHRNFTPEKIEHIDWMRHNSADSPLVIEMSKGLKLYGKILDANYQPIPYAGITIYQETNSLPRSITDEEGNFTVENIFPGTSQVFVEKGSRGQKNYQSLVVNVTVKKKTDTYIEIRWPKGMRVSGQILSYGTPVGNIPVTICSYPDNGDGDDLVESQMLSNTDGMYKFENIPPGKYIVYLKSLPDQIYKEITIKHSNEILNFNLE